ncbi:MAG: hypothetical protein ABSF52_09440 [Syntrophobacteraceae bacterium]|jgi:hypothetical protein
MTEENTPYNAGDPQHVARRERGWKTRDLLKKAALRGLMGAPEGRMWMWDLLTMCGVYHSSFSVEALAMAFNEGRRTVGNFLIGEINRLSPELYMKMAVENEERTRES